MKKLFTTVAGLLSLGCLCADNGTLNEHNNWQSRLSGNVSMKFETEHVDKGCLAIPGRTFVPSAELAYQLSNSAHVYVGIDASLKMKEGSNSKISPYIGCMYDIGNTFTVDLGYSHNFWEATGISVDTKEPYFGVLIDTVLQPSLYLSYDCDQKEFTTVGAVGYAFDLSRYAIDGLGIDLGAHIGYDHCDKPGKVNYTPQMGSKDFVYYGFNADLIYSITDNAKVRTGVACAGNGNSKKSWANNFAHHKNMLWFNASVDCAF